MSSQVGEVVNQNGARLQQRFGNTEDALAMEPIPVAKPQCYYFFFEGTFHA